MSLSDLISYLNSPEPVVKFQKLCGIEWAEEERVEKVVDGLRMGKVFTEKTHFEDISNLKVDKTGGDEEIESIYEELNRHLSNGNFHSEAEDEVDNGENSADEYTQKSKPKFQIKNYFFYYLFLFGAKLGEEIFYISFFPFWLWNVDGFVGRRLCVFWAAFMYLGQACKDVLKMPRPPSPPVVRLESKYNKEFGMPSTHAMVGAGLPFTIYFLTRDRYVFPSEMTLAIAVLWCSVVCLSRIYLGMHSILDVLAGLAFVSILMAISLHLHLLDTVDRCVLKGGWLSLCVCVCVPLFLSFYYPSTHDDWSSARSDTYIILAVCSGSLVAHWLNFNLGHMKRPIGELGFCGSASSVESIFFPASSIHCNAQFLNHHRPIHHHYNQHHHRSSDGSSISQLIPLYPPYPVPPLTFIWFATTLVRTLLGVVILMMIRLIVKHSAIFVLSFFYPKRNKRYKKVDLLPELIQKYLTYSSITVVGMTFCPLLFDWLNIARETYFTEL